MKIEQAFSRRLRYAMNRSRISSKSMSEKTGLSAGTISRYLNGKMIPSSSNLEKLSNILNVDSMWLIGYQDNTENNYDTVGFRKQNDILSEAVRNELIRMADYMRESKSVSPVILLIDEIRNNQERYHPVGMILKELTVYYDVRTECFVIISKNKDHSVSVTVHDRNSSNYTKLLTEYNKNTVS